MPINNATNKFGFSHLSGSDTAGHNSINGLITDIDINLEERVTEPGMIMIYDNTNTLGPPDGWTDYTSSMTSSGVTLPANHIWIKKD